MPPLLHSFSSIHRMLGEKNPGFEVLGVEASGSHRFHSESVRVCLVLKTHINPVLKVLIFLIGVVEKVNCGIVERRIDFFGRTNLVSQLCHLFCLFACTAGCRLQGCSITELHYTPSSFLFLF